MTTRNTELLERAMQHIDDHPEQHDQITWMNYCGTAACFAGWACLLSGWQVSSTWSGIGPMVMSPDTLTESHVPNVATDLLGIDYEEADVLFDGTNSRDMLRLMVKDLVNGDDLRDSEQYRDEAQS